MTQRPYWDGWPKANPSKCSVAVFRWPSFVRKPRIAKPDFLARIRAAYGDRVLDNTATELISESRGER